jgi:hypothetical protein
MMKKITLLLLIFNVLSLIVQAQDSSEKNILVKSWHKGNEEITVQSLQIKLTKENTEFEKEILAMSGKKYLVSVVKNPDVDLKGEHWKVLMNEIVDKKNNKDFCRDLLKTTKPCETGGDYFVSDYGAYFYPYEEKKILINGNPHIEWKPLYPINTIRKFLVDGFYVIIKSGKIEFDEKDKTKICSFELNIDFRNDCDKKP